MSIVSFQDMPARTPARHVFGICLAALIFLILLLLVTQLPALSAWDNDLSQWAQKLRGPVADRVMLAVTLLGDTHLATLLVVLVTGGLLSARRWWLSLHLVSVGLSALLGVSILKSVIGRARPVIDGGALHSFSFPSGHACAAALTAGLLAILFAYRQNTAMRYTIYAVATLCALLVAYSRVHLLAHWPSDVVAGLALGFALIMAFGWQLQIASELNYRFRQPLMVASICLAIAYVTLNYGTEALRYGLG